MNEFVEGLRAGEPKAVDAANRLLGTMAQTPDLTPGQVDVLELTCEGLTDREIARTLHLSLDAVKSRQKALRAVLGARTRAHAVALWLRRR